MYPPSVPYKPPVNQWRDNLFAHTEYLNKQERWELLEQACAYIYSLADKTGKTTLLERSFAILHLLPKICTEYKLLLPF